MRASHHATNKIFHHVNRRSCILAELSPCGQNQIVIKPSLKSKYLEAVAKNMRQHIVCRTSHLTKEHLQHINKRCSCILANTESGCSQHHSIVKARLQVKVVRGTCQSAYLLRRNAILPTGRVFGSTGQLAHILKRNAILPSTT